jgi:DNA gyrase/topoisomerase IV subunit A
MDNPDATTADLMEAIPGPDFPTGGLVMGKSGFGVLMKPVKARLPCGPKSRFKKKKTVNNGSL